jgi:hypothetical protein
MIRKLFSRWHNPAPELDHKAPLGSPEWFAETTEFWRQQHQFWDKHARIQRDTMWLWAVVAALLVAVAVMSAVSG